MLWNIRMVEANITLGLFSKSIKLLYDDLTQNLILTQ